jgi:hypothetical protein
VVVPESVGDKEPTSRDSVLVPAIDETAHPGNIVDLLRLQVWNDTGIVFPTRRTA